MPLGLAAQNGRSCVVRELIKQRGIKGCVGPDGGVQALVMAAQHQHSDTMAILMDAGVIDTGSRALLVAAGEGCGASVKLLLEQQQLESSPTGLVEYVNLLS